MVKVLPCCDCCGQELSEKEFMAQAIRGENVLMEWQLKNFLLCRGCASMIDYSLLKFKSEVLNGTA